MYIYIITFTVFVQYLFANIINCKCFHVFYVFYFQITVTSVFTMCAFLVTFTEGSHTNPSKHSFSLFSISEKEPKHKTHSLSKDILDNNLNLPITPSKRHDVEQESFTMVSPNLPWDCGVDYFWRDLGTHHYPRHIRDAHCSNTTCWFGHFSCRPSEYHVKVLVPNTVGRPDGKIPSILRTEWVFRDIPVTVGCQCAR